MKKKDVTLAEFFAEPKPEKMLAALTYEDGLALLEELVSSVESGQLSLEQSVLSYERGMMLLGHLQQLLQGAEEKLKVLQLPSKRTRTVKSDE
jgi:exodeoxyribonuclease VII small subunit